MSIDFTLYESLRDHDEEDVIPYATIYVEHHIEDQHGNKTVHNGTLKVSRDKVPTWVYHMNERPTRIKSGYVKYFLQPQ